MLKMHAWILVHTQVHTSQHPNHSGWTGTLMGFGTGASTYAVADEVFTSPRGHNYTQEDIEEESYSTVHAADLGNSTSFFWISQNTLCIFPISERLTVSLFLPAVFVMSCSDAQGGKCCTMQTECPWIVRATQRQKRSNRCKELSHQDWGGQTKC